MNLSSSVRISPTAHYTGEVWRRHGLSDPRLATLQGRAFHAALAPAMAVSTKLGGPTLEAFLMARHTLIDHLLQDAIENRGVTQVIEIACGLSPRGVRFSQRYGNRITYIETDLPPMAALKASRLGLNNEGAKTHHQVRPMDALRADGEGSLSALCAQLDAGAATAVITEGLINYFPQTLVLTLWQNIATSLSRFSQGLYLSDIHCRSDNSGPLVDAFVAGLSAFVRGRVGLLFEDATDAQANLLQAGFGRAQLHQPSAWADKLPACGVPWVDLVRVVQAATGV